ncbi:hypothetical protein QQZ08_002745 [Neonectria magnoliae]|uniref:Sulfatase N-terminal domain-containing protein n=1 Tax=Neonectria magnoliae TaxID=2732573 RepID=A0ABR1IBI7_9HYPO
MFASFVPFCFSVIVVSLALSKLVHLYIHGDAIPAAAFVLYLPSFFLPDALVICSARLALRRERSWLAFPACVLGCLMALVILCAASSQLGFFYETGNEIEWDDAMGFAHDAEGMKVLLSGAGAVVVSGILILVLAGFAKSFLYRAVGTFLVGIGAPLVFAWRSIWRSGPVKGHARHRNPDRPPEPSSDLDDYSTDFESDFENDADEAVALVYGEVWTDSVGRSPQCFRRTGSWVAVALGLSFLALTTIFRPASPYNHMSTTLPFPLLDVFNSPPDMCEEQELLTGNRWPLPDLTNSSKWETPTANFKGWAPGTENMFVTRYRKTVPAWLPDPIPSGFSKWIPHDAAKVAQKNASETDGFVQSEKDKPVDEEKPDRCGTTTTSDTFYNPVSDPMKITNLNTDILQVLQEALANKEVEIKHVALIMMESLREELFPIQQGSDIHRFIMESYEEEEREAANARVSRLSPNAEKITGIYGNFTSGNGTTYVRAKPEWNDVTRHGYGGINVVGGLTTSSVSTKSLAAIHCGTWPMPVDKFEESETQSYQPCIPQVLELFNQMKENQSTADFRDQQWYPAFFQSVTDDYDRQAKFDRKIGFKHIVTKNRLEEEAGEDDDLEEINYFGYPETTLKRHMEEYIKDAKSSGKRMFLSHFTSTTHHPWVLPRDFKSTQYLHTQGTMRWHKDFNKYLNTVRWNDHWLGEMMQMFDDQGISNETLVVFVGDHGQAFKEDVSKTGTYENGHISNFRVPIVFRHPNLPRVQYNANATSLSILPTILDLLINTGSLNLDDTAAATELAQDYEGQSLIRPYRPSHNGRRAWNYGIINGGGRMLSITSADAPWRLVLPLDQKTEFRFTDLAGDPLELDPLLKWSMVTLVAAVKSKHGVEASKWLVEAEAVAGWWGLERKRLWGYKMEDEESADSGGDNED